MILTVSVQIRRQTIRLFFITTVGFGFQKQETESVASPLFEKVHHSLEVIDAILSLHVHQYAVRGRLHRNMKEGVDPRMLQYLRHFLMKQMKKKIKRQMVKEMCNK